MGRQKVIVTDLEKAIIKNIRQYMHERDWSENRLSIEAGMVSSTVHRMLAGKQNLTLSYLEQVCNAFGINVSTLVRQSEQTLLTVSARVTSLDVRRNVSGVPDNINDLDAAALTPGYDPEEEFDQ